MDNIDLIIAASREGDSNRVTALLDEDPSLATAANMLGSQPIHAAHFAGHPRVVELLIQRGVTLDVFLSAQLGMLDRVQAAVASAPDAVRAVDWRGSTALHGACYWGQVAVADYLLGQGSDANAVTRDSFLQIRPLGCAVASPDVPNPSDREETVLDLVRLLLEHGADVNGRRRDGLTALHGAAYRGHLKVIRYLLDHGADRSIQGYESAGPHAGQRASYVALEQGHREAADLLGSMR